MEQDIDAPETIETLTINVSCDGGGILGHPKVFLSIGKSKEVECPYCDRRFILQKK